MNSSHLESDEPRRPASQARAVVFTQMASATALRAERVGMGLTRLNARARRWLNGVHVVLELLPSRRPLEDTGSDQCRHSQGLTRAARRSSRLSSPVLEVISATSRGRAADGVRWRVTAVRVSLAALDSARDTRYGFQPCDTTAGLAGGFVSRVFFFVRWPHQPAARARRALQRRLPRQPSSAATSAQGQAPCRTASVTAVKSCT